MMAITTSSSTSVKPSERRRFLKDIGITFNKANGFRWYKGADYFFLVWTSKLYSVFPLAETSIECVLFSFQSSGINSLGSGGASPGGAERSVAASVPGTGAL